MSRTARAYHYSIWLHILILASVVFISKNMGIQTEIVRIDFSLLDASSEPKTIPHSPAPDEIQPIIRRNSDIKRMKAPTQKSVQPENKPIPMEEKNPVTPAYETMYKDQFSVEATEGEKLREKGQAITGNTGAQEVMTGSGLNSALSPESQRQVYMKEHFEYIRRKIMKQMVYPGLARKMGWSGQVTVAFTIQEDGRAVNLRVARSSGFDLLDADAADTVKRSSPFPRPPIRAEIIMPITYELK
mgnify:CR=1 FL=1